MRTSSRNLVLILIALFLASCAQQSLNAQRQVLPGADIIPVGRLTLWEPGKTVGVPGGIPSERPSCATAECVALRTASVELRNGTTNATPLLQAAINSASPNSVVNIPAGTWRIDSVLSVPPTKDSITLRGAGTSTVLDCRSSTCIFVGSSSDYQWSRPSSGNVVTSYATDTSTGGMTLTIGDTSAFSTNQLVNFQVANDRALPVISVAGHDYARKQMTRVVSKTGTTLTVFPALYGYERFMKLDGKVNVAQLQADFVGIEDMKLDGANGRVTFGIWLEQTYGSWLKNVTVIRSSNYGVYLHDSLNCELRQSRLDQLNHSGTNGAGLLMDAVSGCLIEDNIILESVPNVEVNGGSSGNVVAYNFINNRSGLIGIDTNHAPHNSFNLYEGNISHNLISDGYFGSNSDETIFRNLFHGNGVAPGDTLTYCLSLKRFSRNFSIVGNILGSAKHTARCDGYGQPNIGNGSSSGRVQPSLGLHWADWRPDSGTTIRGVLTGRVDDFHGSVTLSSGKLVQGQTPALWLSASDTLLGWGRVGSVTENVVTVDTSSWQVKLPGLYTPLRIEAGSSGFQELDLDVEATTFMKANTFVPSGIPVVESLGSQILPPSLYLRTKPSWFGRLAWPPFDPASPNVSYEAIPAGYRFVRGVDPP